MDNAIRFLRQRPFRAAWSFNGIAYIIHAFAAAQWMLSCKRQPHEGIVSKTSYTCGYSAYLDAEFGKMRLGAEYLIHEMSAFLPPWSIQVASVLLQATTYAIALLKSAVLLPHYHHTWEHGRRPMAERWWLEQIR